MDLLRSLVEVEEREELELWWLTVGVVKPMPSELDFRATVVGMGSEVSHP
jgi:hypothetical protein